MVDYDTNAERIQEIFGARMTALRPRALTGCKIPVNPKGRVSLQVLLPMARSTLLASAILNIGFRCAADVN